MMEEGWVGFTELLPEAGGELLTLRVAEPGPLPAGEYVCVEFHCRACAQGLCRCGVVVLQVVGRFWRTRALRVLARLRCLSPSTVAPGRGPSAAAGAGRADRWHVQLEPGIPQSPWAEALRDAVEGALDAGYGARLEEHRRRVEAALRAQGAAPAAPRLDSPPREVAACGGAWGAPSRRRARPRPAHPAR